MRVKMVCLEDGVTSCGFRKMAAYVEQLHPGTESCYISTERYRSVRAASGGWATRRGSPTTRSTRSARG